MCKNIDLLKNNLINSSRMVGKERRLNGKTKIKTDREGKAFRSN